MLQVRELAVEVGGNVILDGASFSIRARDKVGLVGRNGAGKTSLLKVLGGAADPYAGVVHRSGGLGYLPQDPRLDGVDESTTGVRHILSGRGFDEAMVRIEKLRLQMEEDPSERAVSRFTRAEERFRLDGGYAAESEVRRIAAGLGSRVPTASTYRSARCPVGRSGASRSRASSSPAATCSSSTSPPTTSTATPRNGSSGSCAPYKGALLVISHDLDLLDEAITRVLHLERRDETGIGEIEEYKGTYSEYLVAREKDEVRLAKLAQRQAKEIDRLQALVDRFGAKATKASMAHSIEKRIVRLEGTKVEAPRAGRSVHVRFPPPPPPGRLVMEGTGLAVRYGDLEVFHDVDVVVERGERLLIMGLNGAGKTSLLRVLAGDRPADAGRRHPRAQRRHRLLRPGARGHPARPHDPRAPPRGGAAGRRDRPARHRRRHGPHRRQGAPGRRHPLRRGEDEARPRHPRRRTPQPAAARRAHQQPRPGFPRRRRRRAAGLARAASCW